MWVRVAAGLVAVAALESSGQVNGPWVLVPVAAAVLLFLGVEQLCRRYLRGAHRGTTLRSADLLVAAGAALVLFGIAVVIGAALPGWLGPPGIVAAVLVTHALPDRLMGSWQKLGPRHRLMICTALTLPAVLTVAAAALERMDLATVVAMPVGILIMTVAAAVFPQEPQLEQRHESQPNA